MKFLLLALVSFLLFAPTLSAQSTSVSGKVLTTKRQGLQGASVSIKGGYDGATTDSSGNFSFVTADTGKQVLAISNMGYKPAEQDIMLNGTPIVLEFIMKEAPNELMAVVITAGSFEASDEKKVTVLKPLDIVTTASANADVAAAMRTLPGTQQVGESAELFVRGGEGYETRQFIDGTTVANPFFGSAPNIASRGRFSPFLFKGTVFSTGGYSALYGQALSSALILESIDLPERSSATASVSPIFGGGQYQGLAKNKNSSWGASLNVVHLGAYIKVIKQRPDYFNAPFLTNGDANFRIKTSKTGMLKFYGNYAGNKFGLRTQDIDSTSLKNAFSLNNQNIYTNLSYRERLSNRLKLNAGLSYSINKDDIAQQLQDAGNKAVNTSNLSSLYQQKTFDLVTRGQMAQVRGVLEYKLKGLSNLKVGAEYWYQHDSTQYNNFGGVIEDHFKAGFAEADIYITNKLAGRAGLRAEHSSLLDKGNIVPRASLAYKISGGEQVSFDYGIFYQKPLNQFLATNKDLNYLRADHYIITYQKLLTNRVFRTQVFHKQYDQLVSTFNGSNNSGDGYARGLEFFWRDKITFKNFDYWLTYSYLDTKRNYLNYPYELQPSFAAKHTANIVVKRFFTKLKTQFNINYQYASGRPYYDIAYDASTQKYNLRDQGKTIDYNNLSLSLNHITSIKKAFAVFVISVNNVLNQKQVFGYSYSYNGVNKVPILPPANRFIFIGAFFSWGIDRSQDAINNNL